MIIETEMNCSDICWAEPVRVRVGHGVPVNNRWPAIRLKHHDATMAADRRRAV